MAFSSFFPRHLRSFSCGPVQIFHSVLPRNFTQQQDYPYLILGVLIFWGNNIFLWFKKRGIFILKISSKMALTFMLIIRWDFRSIEINIISMCSIWNFMFDLCFIYLELSQIENPIHTFWKRKIFTAQPMCWEVRRQLLLRDF